MGSCNLNSSRTNKIYKIKMKINKSQKHIETNKVEKLNFEIIDSITQKTKQILIKDTATLSELLTLADYNISGDLDIQLKDNEKINDELNTNIKDILENYFPENKLLTVTIIVTINGLSIPSNVIKAYQEMSPLIGNPIFENPKKFGIMIYNKSEDSAETFYFDKESNEELLKFNSFSSFCSANGLIYISGGEKEEQTDIREQTEEYDDFVFIDMDKINYYNLHLETLPHLTIKRSWHSMIFVPNQYIFIVGGLNTKTVEIYDIYNNTINVDSELKERRCEPTMCLINNTYLYAFCGFHPFQNFNDNIERCNLLKKKREWEFIEYSNEISVSFFGVSYFKDNKILLISSKDSIDEDNKSYIFKIGKDEDSPDEIKEIKLENNGLRTFKDKLFYPIFDNYSINSPITSGEKRPVLFLDMNTGNIKYKNYI